MKTKQVVSILIIVAVLVALGVWIGLSVFSSRVPNPSGVSPYTALYMTTGDIYFGKFSKFPEPHMTDVWFLQRSTTQNNQQQFGIVPFGTAFWGPVDDVHFSSNQILFRARLRNDSQVVKLMENPSLIQQQNNTVPSQQTPAGGAFKGPSGQPPSQNP